MVYWVATKCTLLAHCFICEITGADKKRQKGEVAHEPLAHSAGAYLDICIIEAIRNILLPWQGCQGIREFSSSILPIPIYTPGRRGALWSEFCFCPRKQRGNRVKHHRPLNVKSEALRLHH